MSCLIKSIITATLLIVFSANSLYATGDCLSKYNCKFDVDGTKIKGIEECTLSSMPNMPITATDVFDTNGALKHYFGTGKTVCDVLGWMNEAVPFMREHYEGLNMSVGTNLLPFT